MLTTLLIVLSLYACHPCLHLTVTVFFPPCSACWCFMWRHEQQHVFACSTDEGRPITSQHGKQDKSVRGQLCLHIKKTVLCTKTHNRADGTEVSALMICKDSCSHNITAKCMHALRHIARGSYIWVEQSMSNYRLLSWHFRHHIDGHRPVFFCLPEVLALFEKACSGDIMNTTLAL